MDDTRHGGRGTGTCPHILGSDVLGTLPVGNIDRYLLRTGWVLRRETDTQRIYRMDIGDSWDEVAVPDGEGYSDYAAMVGFLLRTLSDIEGRPREDIAVDLLSGNVSDGIGYRLMTGDGSGAVPVDRMIRVLRAHRAMSAAAYLDLTDPRQSHPSLDDGFRAIGGMRMCQTSCCGCFVRFIYGHPEEGGADGRLVDRTLESGRILLESAERGILPSADSGVSYEFIEAFLGLRSDDGSDLEMFRTSVGRARHEPLMISDGVLEELGRLVDGISPSDTGPRSRARSGAH